MGEQTVHSERRVLRHMTRALSSSDPSMVLLFVNFTRLTQGEELPRTERLEVRRPARWSRRRAARLRMMYVFALFLVTLVACWALALVSTGGAHRNGPAPKQQLTGANSSCANLHELERYLAQLGSTPTSGAPC